MCNLFKMLYMYVKKKYNLIIPVNALSQSIFLFFLATILSFQE